MRMPKIFIVGLLTVAVLGSMILYADWAKESPQQNMQSIDNVTFEQKLASSEYVLIDLRTEEEYLEGVIRSDALFIDFYADEFESQLASLDRDEKYLIYCRSGGRSGETLAHMGRLGFGEVHELDDGIMGWIESGRPLEAYVSN